MPSTRVTQPSPKTKSAKPATKPAAPARSAPSSATGSPAQLLQLQRQYGNRAAQHLLQREAASEGTLQRAGATDATTYKQPNDVLGVTSAPQTTKDTPRDELQSQVRRLIEHAELASADFKTMLTGIIATVNAEIPGGCVNGDPTFQYVTKTLESALLKAQGRMDDESVADMKDVLRGTIRCKNVQALNKAQALLTTRAAELMQLTEITVGATQKKDGFARRAGDMVGYGDIKFLTPVVHGIFTGADGAAPRPDFWMYAEIQLMTDEMNAKKMEGGGHTFYDLTRDAKAYKPPKEGGVTHYVEPNEIVIHATQLLLEKHYAALERGVNPERMATLVPKLIKLGFGQRIDLTKGEYEALELASELIYRRERVEGNLARQGIGAGQMTGTWQTPTASPPTPRTRPRR